MVNATPIPPRPVCPRCEITMRLSRVAPYFLGTTCKTYECQLCDLAIVRPLQAEAAETAAVSNLAHAR
jgi:hypothetical protein